jgi:hypothetical protein
MAPDNTKKLEELRTKIIDDLGAMSDELAGNDAVSVDALVSIARTTGRPELLEKAVVRAEAIEDGPERADALLDLLDEVDAQLNSQVEDESDQGTDQAKDNQSEVSSDPASVV